MTKPFVHLHLHSEYSIVDSTVRIPALMKRAAQSGMPAVALTDQANLFGLVKFYRKALAGGVKPIIGVDIKVRNPEEDDRPWSMILLCQDLAGYRNLTRLVSRSYLEGQQRGIPMIETDWIDQDTAMGLIALSGGMNGDIGRALIAGHPEQAASLADHWRSIFGDRFYIEVTRLGRPGEEACLQESIKLADQAGIPIVATNDVRFIDPEDFEAHEARVCIQNGRTLADPDRPRNYTDKQFLRDGEAMSALFEDIPEAIENTIQIARRCSLDLKLGESFLPAFPVPEGQTTEGFLRSESEHSHLKRSMALLPVNTGGGVKYGINTTQKLLEDCHENRES